MKNFKPILYSTSMVQSILKNLKNQTRRTKGLEFFNNAPEKYRYDGNDQPDLLEPLDKNYHWFEFIGSDGKPMEAYKCVKCPYGQVGDILWVRESFAKDGDSYLHRASHALVDKFIKWKPSIHMPKDAARIFLQITDITVERLHDISEADAKNEGVKFWYDDILEQNKFFDYVCAASIGGEEKKEFSFYPWDEAKDSFISLWKHINGFDSFLLNPWVWVIKFERIEKPQIF